MKIALVGIGKIARDQHLPAIATSADWQLAAAVSRHEMIEGVENFIDFDEMLAARPDIATVSLCLPPAPRFDYAVAALRAGRNVMLEKPPAASLADAQALVALAHERNRTLYATWHSRMGNVVAPAKAWLKNKAIHGGTITWHEDVRKWHPDQDWVFEDGGMGVFDPGINALSILTDILPTPVNLKQAVLEIPANRAMPIAARLTLNQNITASFDWREATNEEWTIAIETGSGTLELRKGGHALLIDGEVIDIARAPAEYPSLYARMAELVRNGESEADLEPLVLVEQALNSGKRSMTDAFEF